MKIRKLIKILVNLFVLSGLMVGVFSSSMSSAQAPVTSDSPETPSAPAVGGWYIVELDKPSLAH